MKNCICRSLLLGVLFALGILTAVPQLANAQSGGSYVSQQGFYVSAVFPNTTAFSQGLEVRDIIVSVDRHPIRSGQDLRFWIGRAGNVAQLEVIDWRTGRLNQMTVYPNFGRIGIDGYTVQLNGNGGGPPGQVPQSPYGNSPNGGAIPAGRPIPSGR